MKRKDCFLDLPNSEYDNSTLNKNNVELVFQSFNWLASKTRYKLRKSDDGELLEELDNEFIMQCFGIAEKVHLYV